MRRLIKKIAKNGKMNNQKKSVEDYHKVLKDAELLYTNVQIHNIVEDIAKAVSKKLGDTNPIVMPVMIGGLITAGQLIPKLNFPLEVDYIHATRYSSSTQGGKLVWLKKPDKSLLDRTILLIDDILDEGITLSEIITYCYSNGAKNVLTFVLVKKELENRKLKRDIDFVGTTVPNVYVFGQGMDYCEYYRNINTVSSV